MPEPKTPLSSRLAVLCSGDLLKPELPNIRNEAQVPGKHDPEELSLEDFPEDPADDLEPLDEEDATQNVTSFLQIEILRPSGDEFDLATGHLGDDDHDDDDDEDFRRPLDVSDEDHLEMSPIEQELLGEDLDDAVFDNDDEEKGGDEEDDNETLLLSLLTAYLRLNPNPTDDQFHSLANALGVDHESLEQSVFSIMAVMLENQD